MLWWVKGKIGWVPRPRKIKNYPRGGGLMLWWVNSMIGWVTHPRKTKNYPRSGSPKLLQVKARFRPAVQITLQAVTLQAGRIEL